MERAKADAAIVQLVARNVRALRKNAGLSQEELAYQAGVDRTYISQVERGLRNLTISVLARVARALKTTPDQLLIAGAASAAKRVQGAKRKTKS